MSSNEVLNIEVRAAVASATEELRRLGDELGGNVGAKALALSQRLTELSAHDDAITFFKEMQQQAAQSERAFRQLFTQLEEYERQLGTSTDPKHVVGLEQLRSEVRRAADEWDKSRQQLSVATQKLHEFGTTSGTAQRAQERLRKEMSAGSDKAQLLVQHMRALTTSTNVWQRAMEGVANVARPAIQRVSSALQPLKSAIESVHARFGRLYELIGGGFSAGAFVSAVTAMQDVRVALTAVAGSAEEGARQFDFVKRVARSAGTDIGESAQQWMKLSAAAKGTALEGQASRDVFQAVTDAMSNMGRSGSETGAVLQTLTQIINGEDVSARQLERTLGTQLPGALQAAAKGFGVTEAELRKMRDSGEITAEKLLPALAKGLNETTNAAPQVAKVSDAFQNVKNAFLDFADLVGQAGVSKALVLGADVATAAIQGFGAAVVYAGKVLGIWAAAIRNMDFSNITDSFREAGEEFKTTIATAAQNNEVLRASMEMLGGEAGRAALAEAEAATKAQEAGAAAEAAAPQLAALGLSYKQLEEEASKVKDAQKLELEVIQERIKAAEAEAAQEGLTAEAKLKAQETLQEARKAEAAYYEDIVKKKEAALQAAQNDMAATIEASKVSQEEAERLAPVIDNLKKLILQREKDALAARAQAKEHSLAAAQTKAAIALETEAYKARKAGSDASIQLLEAQKQLAAQEEKLAALAGNDYKVRQMKIQQLELEIEITKVKVAAKRAEAEHDIAALQLKEADLRATGKLTGAAKAEIDAAIKLAEAKRMEADALEKGIAIQRRAVQQARSLGTATSETAQQSREATTSAAAGWREVAAEADAARSAVDGYSSSVRGAPPPPSGRGGSSSSKASNRNASITSGTWMSAYNAAKQFGADDELARQLADMQYDSNGRRTGVLTAQMKRGRYDFFSETEAIRRAVELAMRNNVGAAQPAQQGGSAGSASAAGAASGATVNINLNGKRTSIGVGSAADAHQLERLLREIANDAERAA